MNPGPAQRPWWRRLTQLAVFPLLVYLVLTQLIRENYPFSHYPMYSRPNSKALRIQFLADGDGQPLPVGWHTGITPSKVAKLHGDRVKRLRDDRAAALEVLQFLRASNARRRGRELPPRIRLMETTIAFQDGRFAESERALAEHAAPSPP